MEDKIPLLVLLGPTGVGKTKISLALAKYLGGEIISMDSMAIYKEMNIGTAKPSFEERKKIVHHMLDVVEPYEEFTVAKYSKMTKAIIKDIHKRGKKALLVGGTGLYLKSVIEKINFGEAKPDLSLRNKWLQEIEKKGKEEVYAFLQKVDPKTASRLHPNDLKRIVRALEIYEQIGKPMSEIIKSEECLEYDLTMLGLNLSREVLYERINLRVDKMLEEGLIEEVKALKNRGYDEKLTSMQGIGYKEILTYLRGEISLEEAIELIKMGSRRLAKRQLTWFRRDKRIRWIDLDDKDFGDFSLEEDIKNLLNCNNCNNN